KTSSRRGPSRQTPVITRWDRPERRASISTASAGSCGFPRIRSPIATTVSAARTRACGRRAKTSSALTRARRSAARAGSSPGIHSSSAFEGTTSKTKPAEESSCWRLGDADARMRGRIDEVRAMGSDDLLQRLQRTIEELEAFNEIGKVLTSTLDIHEVLRRIMDKVQELLEPANWSLLLVDPETESLVFEFAKGPGADRLEGERIGLDEGIAGWVVSRKKPLLVQDVRKDPRF